MKLILTLILLSSLAMAQWGPGGIPTDWRGYGLEWMESEKFTSDGATSYISLKSDTLAIISTTVGDADIFLNFQEADGTKHLIKWDDGLGRWVLDETLEVPGTILGGTIQATNRFRTGTSSNSMENEIDGTYGRIETNGTIINLKSDPNSTGQGVNQLGETGDNDVTLLQSNLRGAFITSAVQDTIGTAECIYFEQTANEPVYLPPSPTTGDTHRIKFTHASGGTLDGNGNTIDGNATISASEDNAYMVVFNGVEWGIW